MSECEQRRAAPHLHQEVEDGFALLDEELRFRRVNEAMAALNGVPVAEHLGRTVNEVLPRLASTLEPLLHQVLATGEPVIDVEIRGALVGDGPSQRWLASYYPVRSRSGAVIAIDAVVRALPARSSPVIEPASLAALRERERFAAGITEVSPNLIYVFDLEQQRNCYVNRCITRYGYTVAEIETMGPESGVECRRNACLHAGFG